MTTLTVRLLTPEIVLIAAAVAIYLGGTFSATRQAWNWMAVGAIAVAAFTLWAQHGAATAGGPLGSGWAGLARPVADARLRPAVRAARLSAAALRQRRRIRRLAVVDRRRLDARL